MENKNAKAIKQVLSVDEIKYRLSPVFKFYNVKKAILFGSYSKGLENEQSDVDLVVDSGLKGLSFVGLIETVKEALHGKDVDVLDISHIIKNSHVEREIMTTGVEIYAK